MFSKPVYYADFVAHGEFAFYAASIVSATFYIVARNYPIAMFPYRPYFLLFLIGICLWCSLITGGVFLGEAAPPSPERMAALTIPAFLLVMIVSVFALLLEQQMNLPDPHVAADQQVADLGKRVRSQRKKSTPASPVKEPGPSERTPEAGGENAQ